MVLTAIGMAIMFFFNFQYQSALLAEAVGKCGVSAWINRLHVLVLVTAIASTPFLAALSICDMYVNMRIHLTSALIFFTVLAVACTLNTIVSYKIQAIQPYSDTPLLQATKDENRKTFRVQVTLSVIYLIALSYEIAVSSHSTTFGYYTVQDCIKEGFGTKNWCEHYAQPENPLLTKFPLYAPANVDIVSFASVCEYTSALALIGYSMSFVWHRFDLMDRVMDVESSAYSLMTSKD